MQRPPPCWEVLVTRRWLFTAFLWAQLLSGAAFRIGNEDPWEVLGDPALRPAIMRSMTLDQALELLQEHPDAPPQLLAVAQQMKLIGSRRGGLRRLQAIERDMSTESALGMLNRLVVDAERKKDLECRQCYDYREKQRGILLDMQEDMTMDSMDVVDARQEIMKAENEINALKERVADTQDMLSVLSSRCSESYTTLKQQLVSVTEDVVFMENTTGDTFCQSQRSFLLQRCKQTAKGRVLAQTAARHRSGSSRCLLHGNHSCEHVRELFLQLHTQTSDRKDALHKELQDRSSSCEEEKSNYDTQINSLETKNSDEQAKLALAMAKKNEADERMHMKASQIRQQTAEHSSMVRRCREKVQGVERQICGLRKIRGELEKLQGEDAAIRDCEVTKWTAEECSVTCGGGTQRITRKVVVHADRGAQCPPLEGVQPCNEEPCPVPCRVDDWSGWSGCSALCGGGVRERVRRVVARARHGGDPCGETVSTQPCGQGPCDRDCRLAAWSPWSVCSLGCGGGLKSRVRKVIAPAVGGGACPRERSHVRLEYSKCNNQACAQEEHSRCGRKLDVVLLLDGGGGLGMHGWEQLKEAAARLSGLFDGGSEGVQLAVQLFSGPRTEAAYHNCTTASGLSTDWLEECGIRWVTHLTPDTPSIGTQIRELRPLAGSSFLSAALALARAELGLGRRDASRVVVVVTDRKPLNPSRVQEVAQRIQRGARLVWVPVSHHAPVQYFKQLASRPVRDNVLFVRDSAGLANASTVDVILRSICYQLQ